MRILLLTMLMSFQVQAASPVMGNNLDAPVKMLIAGSIQCPFAKRFMDYLPQFQAEFGDDLSIQYIHMPLPRQPQAFPAAVASECAKEQSLFWPFLTAAFERQRELGRSTYLDIARQLNEIHLYDFEACLDEVKIHQRVESERNAAQAMGVSGTPSIFINGEFIVGAYPYEHFQEIIQNKLEQN